MPDTQTAPGRVTAPNLRDGLQTTPHNACPVVALGQNKGVRYYMATSGEVIGLSAAEHKREILEGLFGGDMGWAEAQMPQHDRDGNLIGYNLNELRQYLLQRCHEAGWFDPTDQVRGPGVWREADGSLTLHCGDQVFHQGRWLRAGDQYGDYVYTAARPEPRPAESAASAQQGEEFVRILNRWNWKSTEICPGFKMAAALYAGFVGCSYVSGALTWRPSILVTGGRGTGKSLLNELYENIVGEQAIYKCAAPSAAGVRQDLNGAASPVMTDEIEADADNSKYKALVELARLGSTDGQGKVTRGSAGGKAMSWIVRSCFYFSSILHPPLAPQDASRICVLDLDRIEATPDQSDDLKAQVRALTDMSATMRRRMIDGWERLARNKETFTRALSALGADSRQCDQYATLLAAHHVMVEDEPVSSDKAAELSDILMTSEIMPDDEDAADHVQCLAHLLSTPVDIPGEQGRERMVLGTLINRAFNDRQAWAPALGTYGIVIRVKGGDSQHIVVSKNHRGLEPIFRGTRWQGGVWAQSLSRWPEAITPRTSVWFGGTTGRGVWLPLQDVLQRVNARAARGETVKPTHAEDA